MRCWRIGKRAGPDRKVRTVNNPIPIAQLDKTFVEFHPDTWREVQNFATLIPGWVFRGQGCSTWNLETSLERCYKSVSPTNSISQCEKSILDRFKRGAHHFISCPPSHHNALEWLAIIQHYGGPTRLLDFTRFFYVAVFFAMEAAKSDAAVWCLNTDLLRETSKQLLSCIGEDFEPARVCDRIINDGIDIPATINIEPYRLNERLIAQQGLFVMPCSLNSDVETCLFNTINDEPVLVKRSEYDMAHLELGSFAAVGKVLKILLPKAIHNDARKTLRSMNIDAASLFPGLDGFARSLRSYF